MLTFGFVPCLQCLLFFRALQSCHVVDDDFLVISPAPPCAVVDTFRPTEEEKDALPLARWKASASGGGSFIPLLLPQSGARGRRSLVRSTGRAPRTADGAPDRRSETGREDDLLCSRCKCNETRRSVGCVVRGRNPKRAASVRWCI